MKFFRRFVMVLAVLAAAVALHALAGEWEVLAAQSRESQQAEADQPSEVVKKLAERSGLVVLGEIVAVHDGTARDAGMSYDVKVVEILKGAKVLEIFKGKYAKGTLRFRSAGWVGYARYGKGEKVLLFLYYWAGSKPPELLQLQPITYVAEEEQPTRGLRLWPLEPYLRLLRGNSAGDDRPASLPMGREPTAECPIVSDVGVPGSRLLFGGKDGSKRIRIEWPARMMDVKISPDSQCAAALVADRSVTEPDVIFYDVEGQQIAKVPLPRGPAGEHLVGALWLGDRQEAVAHVAGRTRANRPPHHLIQPGVYYVNAKGTAETLPLDQVYDVYFPKKPGFALLMELESGWHLQRYESPKRLVWEKTFAPGTPRPNFRWPESGGDLAIYAGGLHEYGADGTEVTGGSSE